LFSAKLICVEFYPRTSPITIAGDRTARWAKPLHAAKEGPSLGKHAQRSPPNLCSVGYTTFTALLHDKFLRPTALVESMRRLRASTEIHSWWLVFFTVVLVVLTIVLAGLTFVLALTAAHELHWITP